MCRHVTASGLPGCLPNNNPIESYHAGLVRMRVLTCRANLETFLNQAMPKTLHIKAMDLCSPVQRSLPMKLASSLHCALALLNADISTHVRCVYPGHPKLGQGFETAEKPNEDGVWGVYLLNATAEHTTNITADRVCMLPLAWNAAAHPPFVVQADVYMKSLKGQLPSRTTVASFADKVQTLHRIQVLCPDKDLKADNYCLMFRCDCKGYWKTFQCSHVHALAHWCVHATAHTASHGNAGMTPTTCWTCARNAT